jgi:hypothetical protein
MQVLPRRARTARAVKEAKEAAPAAGRAAGSVARPLRPAARPLYTRFAKSTGAFFSEAAVRPNPRREAKRSRTAASTADGEVQGKGKGKGKGRGRGKGAGKAGEAGEAVAGVPEQRIWEFGTPGSMAAGGAAGLDEGLPSFPLPFSFIWIIHIYAVYSSDE